jgi:hypothetical protein
MPNRKLYSQPDAAVRHCYENPEMLTIKMKLFTGGEVRKTRCPASDVAFHDQNHNTYKGALEC